MTIDYKQQAIDHCLNNFDFNRVFDVMQHLKWEWFTGSGFKVPSKLELMESAKRRLCSAWDLRTTVESGGLRASYVPADLNEDGEIEPPCLTLMFVLTQIEPE